jgi:hypothetical protein
MKATTIILATVLTLSMNLLFANNDGVPTVNTEMNYSTTLAPTTPNEATFEEMVEANVLILAPVTPIEADFSDVAPAVMIDLTSLAPVTPSEADFTADEIPTNSINLAPVNPEFADFSETI